MRRMRNIFLFVVPLLLYSCVETIELDTVPVNKILVVNSLITPDTLFWCYVSKVYSINDSTPHFVDNASVKIFDNKSGELVCNLILDSAGMYRALNSRAEMGKEYRIEVESTDYPIVTGFADIPSRQEASRVAITESAGYEALINSDYSEIYYSINDQFPYLNFYEVQFSGFSSTNIDLIVGTNQHAILDDSIYNIEDATGFSDYTIVDAVIKAEGQMKYNPSTLVFSDNLFNMQQHDFIIRCYPLSTSAYSFTLYTLSEDLYKFRTSLSQHLYERGAKGISRFDDFAGLDFSSKAIDVYSNLKGGYGIFAGYNSQMLFSKFDTITYTDPYTGKVFINFQPHSDTLSDGRIKIIIDQLKNPYEK
jgi:hypothetical protein